MRHLVAMLASCEELAWSAAGKGTYYEAEAFAIDPVKKVCALSSCSVWHGYPNQP